MTLLFAVCLQLDELSRSENMPKLVEIEFKIKKALNSAAKLTADNESMPVSKTFQNGGEYMTVLSAQMQI